MTTVTTTTYKMLTVRSGRLFSYMHPNLAGCSIEYIIDEFVSPSLLGSKLFAYKDFDAIAAAYRRDLVIGASDLEAWRCEAENPIDYSAGEVGAFYAVPRFWKNWSPDRPKSTTYCAPVGTILCDRIKLVEKVSIDDLLQITVAK